MKKGLVSLVFIALALLISCSGGGSGDSQVEISRLGITDAASLFIAPSLASGSSRSTSNINKLFKITESGYIEEVTYYDENENEMTVLYSPIAIYNVNSEFTVVVFDTGGYLVRKSDGAVFSLDNVGVPPYDFAQGYYFENAPIIQTDSDGNIYYQVMDFGTGEYSIVKIDISNPGSLTKTDYTPDTDNVLGFTVTSEGHVAYNYDGGFLNRIKKSNGGLYNLPDLNGGCFWVGLDGNIKYQKSSSEPNTVVSVNIDSSYNVTTSENSGSLDWMHVYNNYLIEFSDRTIGVSVDSEYINELENPSNTPRAITISEISDIKLAMASSDYYYLSGNDGSNNPLLVKVDPTDDSVTTLLSAGDYDIYMMNVSSDNVVTFNALRMSDGVKVIGEIDASGAVTILDESLNTEVVILERIN